MSLFRPNDFWQYSQTCTVGSDPVLALFRPLFGGRLPPVSSIPMFKWSLTFSFPLLAPELGPALVLLVCSYPDLKSDPSVPLETPDPSLTLRDPGLEPEARGPKSRLE